VSSSPDVKFGTFATHRDDNDPSGQDRWDSWYDLSLNCWRVMHWSDTTTLGVRYNLVNQMGLRGVGLWTLNYGGGSGELWRALQTYFKGCYSVSLSANPAATVLAGTPVTLSASAGCPDPNPVYQFFVLAPGAGSWTMAQPYSTSSTYTWNTAGLFPGVYRLAVWARDSGSSGQFSNSLGTLDTSNSITYTVTTQPCSVVSLGASPPTTAAVGSAVNVSAHASSSCPNAQYQFWVMPPGSSSFTVAQAYSASATFGWNTTNKVPGVYTLAVWARDTSSPGTFGNSLGRWDASTTTQYRLTTCTGITLSSVPASTTKVGGSVNFTATATGCPNANPLYQFWVLAPGASAWTVAQPYSTTNTFAWATAGKAPGSWHVAVWTRDASSAGANGNSLGNWDLMAWRAYTVTTCTGASLSGAPASPASVGASVTFTATATGCPNPNPVYQFWVLAPGASSWTMVQPYSTSNTFIWSTTGKAPGTYQVAVWVRDASSGGTFSNSLGAWDVGRSTPYTLK